MPCADVIAAVSGASPFPTRTIRNCSTCRRDGDCGGAAHAGGLLDQRPAPNAFATGRDPSHSLVAITTGLRHKLDRDELQGVIAHEMSHIRNYDIRLMMLLAVLVGMVVMLTDLFWQIIFRTEAAAAKGAIAMAKARESF